MYQGHSAYSGIALVKFFPSNVVLIRMCCLTKGGAYLSKYGNYVTVLSVKSLFLDCFRNSDGEQLQL